MYKWLKFKNKMGWVSWIIQVVYCHHRVKGRGGQSQRRLEPEVVSDAGRGQEEAKDAGASRNGKVKEIDLPWGLRRNQSWLHLESRTSASRSGKLYTFVVSGTQLVVIYYSSEKKWAHLSLQSCVDNVAHIVTCSHLGLYSHAVSDSGGPRGWDCDSAHPTSSQVLGHRHTLSRKDLESNVETEREVVFVSM